MTSKARAQAGASTANTLFDLDFERRRRVIRKREGRLTHQSREPLERPRDPDTGVDFYQNSLCSMDVNL